jgi:hypothetical protein
LQQKEKELELMIQSNKKLNKENNLFKQEFRMLMNTIKNLQSHVTELKESQHKPNQPKNFDMDRVKLGRLQRKYKFLEQENKRLKEIQGCMRIESQRDFTKMIEMNKYYKILNQELEDYVGELKQGLGRFQE